MKKRSIPAPTPLRTTPVERRRPEATPNDPCQALSSGRRPKATLNDLRRAGGARRPLRPTQCRAERPTPLRATPVEREAPQGGRGRLLATAACVASTAAITAATAATTRTSSTSSTTSTTSTSSSSSTVSNESGGATSHGEVCNKIEHSYTPLRTMMTFIHPPF